MLRPGAQARTVTYPASIAWTSSIDSKSNRPVRAATVKGAIAYAPATTHNSPQTIQPLSAITIRPKAALPLSVCINEACLRA